MSDAYFMSLQSNIIEIVVECQFITMIDCSCFFYQWRVHFANRYKLTIITHRDQETFNVTIMKFRNSFFYVQRQINRDFRAYQQYARVYIDDIVIFSKTQSEHIVHLRNIFRILSTNNIVINLKKIYIDYSSITLLKEQVIFLDLFTDVQKMKTIANLDFLKTLEQLKIYLDLTEWFRKYVSNYVRRFEFLQNRKIQLLKSASKASNVRKFYFSKTKIHDSFIDEIASFKYLQDCLSTSRYFVHYDFNRQLYIDLNLNKEDIDAMIYHVIET